MRRGGPGVAAWLLAAVLITACTAAGPPLSLTIRAAAERDRFAISGTTDLPDGAVIRVVAAPSTGANIPFPTPATVQNGTYSASVDTARWEAGTELVVVATFFVGPDSNAAVVERFGSNGERLTGQGVREDSDGVRIFQVSTRVTLSGSISN